MDLYLKKQHLVHWMHHTFKDETCNLDMDDLATIWEAIIIKWEIPMPTKYERFVDHVNSQASLNYSHFKSIFDEYFDNES